MRFMANRFANGLAVAVAMLAAGCGGEDGPPLVPVGGVVKYEGKPLEHVELTFAPDPSNKDVTPGTAMTDADGSYKARYQSRFGLAEGKYKISLRKIEVQADANVPTAIKGDPTQMEMMGLVKNTLPKKYAELDKTSFNIEVKSGATDPFDFELDAKGR
jgi:hypothetical protein